MHQILTETDILGGWHEAFQWQWNAALSMIGFVLAYPVTSSTPSAREAINSAISVFEKFSKNFAAAASAANVTRDLAAKADFLIDRFRTNLTTLNPSLSSNIGALQLYTDLNLNNNHANNSSITFQLEEESPVMFQNTLADSMGSAFTIDSFNGFEPLSPGDSNMFDT